MRLGCRACGRTFKVLDNYHGKIGKCPKCGHQLTVALPEPPPALSVTTAEQVKIPQTLRGPASRLPKRRYCGVAIAGFAFSIAGACTLGLTGLVGIVLGLIALARIRRSDGLLRGKGLAVSGLVLGGAWVVMLTLPAVVLLVAYHQEMVEAAWAERAQSNMQQVCAAALHYAEKNNSKFPSADSWLQSLTTQGYLKSSVVNDPGQPSRGRIFAMNALMGGSTIKQHHDLVVLFFEVTPSGPLAGGRGDFPASPCHGNTFIVGFADGHAMRIDLDGLNNLCWTEEQAHLRAEQAMKEAEESKKLRDELVEIGGKLILLFLFGGD